jgi:hypothetical protein
MARILSNLSRYSISHNSESKHEEKSTQQGRIIPLINKIIAVTWFDGIGLQICEDTKLSLVATRTTIER